MSPPSPAQRSKEFEPQVKKFDVDPCFAVGAVVRNTLEVIGPGKAVGALAGSGSGVSRIRRNR
jgi:flagellar biosynthesis/type III secretory pathway ATPase